MPYLSRVWMNPLRRQSQLFLANPHAMHAVVMGGLSRQPVAERLLWRLTAGRHRVELLVLSDSLPSWEHVIEQAGWPRAAEPQQAVRDYQVLLDRVVLGRTFHFRVHANPVTSTRTPLKPSGPQEKQLAQPRPRGVRMAHRTAGHQFTWLMERIERWGFQPVEDADGNPSMRLIGRDRMEFVKRSAVDSHRVVLNSATFDGIVRVIDPAAARASLLAGVGPAKGYGCGLITLAPVRDGAG